MQQGSPYNQQEKEKEPDQVGNQLIKVDLVHPFARDNGNATFVRMPKTTIIWELTTTEALVPEELTQSIELSLGEEYKKNIYQRVTQTRRRTLLFGMAVGIARRFSARTKSSYKLVGQYL